MKSPFTKNEQSAILQGFWQLMQAKPTEKVNDYIESLTAHWNLEDGWLLAAVTQETQSALRIIANMDNEKKKLFKSYVIDIVKLDDDIDFRIRMAMTLFDTTNVSYAVQPKSWLFADGNNNKYEII